jgi:hypothetical protein
MDPIDTLFAYRGLGGCHSRCRVRIFPLSGSRHESPDSGNAQPLKAEGPLILLTELPGNPGTSITNAAELVATQVVTAFGLDLQTCRPLWVEQYHPHHMAYETFAWIQLVWTRQLDPITNRLVFTATRATWTPLTRETLERRYLFEPLP